MKKCNRCLKVKTDSEFVNSKGIQTTRCLKCNEDRKIQATRRYEKKKNEISFKLSRRNSQLKSKYGIDIKEFDRLINEQNGLCAICDKNLLLNKLDWKDSCVDHDHKNGKVRGILCRQCNLSLSMVEDNNFLIRAVQYLNKLKNI